MFGLGAKSVSFEILLVITEISTHVSLLRPQGHYVCNKTPIFLPGYSSKQGVSSQMNGKQGWCARPELLMHKYSCDLILIAPKMPLSVLPIPLALVIFSDNQVPKFHS